jgi:hypothetical protein
VVIFIVFPNVRSALAEQHMPLFPMASRKIPSAFSAKLPLTCLGQELHPLIRQFLEKKITWHSESPKKPEISTSINTSEYYKSNRRIQPKRRHRKQKHTWLLT